MDIQRYVIGWLERAIKREVEEKKLAESAKECAESCAAILGKLGHREESTQRGQHQPRGVKATFSLDRLAQIPAITDTIMQHGKGVTGSFIFRYPFHSSSSTTE